MPVNPFALTEGVPTGRVGERLVQARREAGMGRWRASRVAQISRANLVRMERGRMRPPDGTLIALCRTYDVAVSWLVPERSGNEVVVGAGRIEVAGRTRVLTGGHGDGERAVEAVLASYLAIVRELRGVGAGGVVSLRDEDLVALARALGDTPSEIEARLVDLMKLSREEARAVRRELLKRRVAVPAAGLLLATAAVAGSLDSGSGGGADLAAGGTFAGTRAEHAVDQGGTGGGASVSLPGDGAAGGAAVAAAAADTHGGTTATPNVSVDGGDVAIGDAVSFVRDTPPPAAPRVVIPLPSVAETPAADGSVDAPDAAEAPKAPKAPDAPGADVAVVVADPGTAGTPAGDTGTVDTGTVDTGTVDPGAGAGGQNGGTDNSAQNDNAHGANDNANPNAADAGGNNDAGGNTSGGGNAANENAHGANDNASSNATGAAANGNQSDAGGNGAGGGGNASAGGDVADGTAGGGTSNGDNASGNANAHGGNANASGNAADAGGNAGPGNEHAGAASPSANGNGASNAHAHP
jgi:transcriptional regulator with XRE-family HTH domain